MPKLTGRHYRALALLRPAGASVAVGLTIYDDLRQHGLAEMWRERRRWRITDRGRIEVDRFLQVQHDRNHGPRGAGHIVARIHGG